MEAMRDMSMEPDGQWMHDLRNVINALGSGVALSRRLLEKGRATEALGVLVQTEDTLKDCFALLAGAHNEHAGDGTGALHAPRQETPEGARNNA